MIGRKKELSFLSNGLHNNGSLRCAVLVGEDGIGKTTFINELGDKLKANKCRSVIMHISSSDCDDLVSLLSSLGRKMTSADREIATILPKFSRQLGSDLTNIESIYRQSGNEEIFLDNLAESFVKRLEGIISEKNENISEISPVIIIDDLDEIDLKILEWFYSNFNQKIRKSHLFKNCRFLFSVKKKNNYVQDFLDKFGIARPTFIYIPPFSRFECTEFANNLGLLNDNLENAIIKSKGIPLKLLNILQNHTKLQPVDKIAMSTSNTKNKPVFSDFSEKELNYLLFASYPNRISRYNLEFFCSPKDAAFCFNWLKRQKTLADIQPDGDLILNEEFRSQMREFHKQEEPEKAQEMSNTATIIDTFSSIFPNPNHHWIPINLQAFNSFTKDLCKKLFNELEVSEIFAFLEDSEGSLNISNKQFSLKDDVKLVTQRFIEIGGGEPKENLCENAKREWLKYQEESKEKRNRLEQEKLNLEEESFDAEKQILSLGELKKQLLENFQRPKTGKSKREFSFSTSILLIVIGVGTIGFSLFVDSLGSYHAACGLALTLFGFFWPNIDIRKEALQSAGSAPKLAIETQQRSLSHRINGLSSRVTSINTNLEGLNSDLENLDQGINAPYIVE